MASNADVIRSMTDEQLSVFLEAVEDTDIHFEKVFCSMCKEDRLQEEHGFNCDSCRLWWLKEDATAWNGLKHRTGENSGYVEPEEG